MMQQNSKDIINQINEAISDKRGRKITNIDMSLMETAPASNFIICQGNSTTQVAAIADEIRDRIKKNFSLSPYNYDGYRNSQWIVIDYGDIMVHVFLPEYREFYNLEDLWSDADIKFLPDED